MHVHHFPDDSQPLPFDDDDEIARLTPLNSVDHLVQPLAPPRTGFYSELTDPSDRGGRDDSGTFVAAISQSPHHPPTARSDATVHSALQGRPDASSDEVEPHRSYAVGDAPGERRRLRAIDRFERQRLREDRRREHAYRLAGGRRSRGGSDDSRHRTGSVDVGDELSGVNNPDLRDLDGTSHHSHHRRENDLSDHPPLVDGPHVAVGSPLMSRRATVLHGLALLAYVVLLPYVVATRWNSSSTGINTNVTHLLLIALSALWFGFLTQVWRNVIRLRHGHQVHAGGSAWLASLFLTVVALLVTPSAHPTSLASPAAISHRAPTQRHPNIPVPELTPGVAVALAAKRRLDRLRDLDEPHPFSHSEENIDAIIRELRGRNPELLSRLATLVSAELSGEITIPRDLTNLLPATHVAPVVVNLAGSQLFFAHEGGQLTLPPTDDSTELDERLVALHDGRLVIVDDENSLLRALATRHLHRTLVVWNGSYELDDELAACCVSLYFLSAPLSNTSEGKGHLTSSPSAIRVELLRADPTVTGLVEPFTSSLRRRCIEMTAYLALHRHESVTGERLRTRVLSHADVDASQRTLANTASAVRRSLGSDHVGPRLHPATASGLYVTHGVTSDVEEFCELIARARELHSRDGAEVAQRALGMVKGEVLASALRGFEWFLAEGHAARLARDGEFGALLVHHEAVAQGNYDVAFWALQQGLLVDPYSDALADAISRVPRLRQFGGDRTRRAQNETVRPQGTVSMGWSLTGFSKQVFQ